MRRIRPAAPEPNGRATPFPRLIGALVLAAAVGSWVLAGGRAAPAALAHDPTDAPGAAPGVATVSSEAAPAPRASQPSLAAAGEPLTAADRDLLVKVRLAGLWETPAGSMAAQKGVSDRVREIGSMIGSQHRQLDALVVEAARAVGVPLPDEPTADQQRWLAELEDAEGTHFDQVFVSRLRAAHGKVFPVIADVRVGTRNTVVRQLAQSANGFVLTHLTLLESTALVDYDSLPPPPAPPAPPTSGSAAALTGLADRTVTFVTTQPWAGGILLPVVLLLIVPRILRRAVRRRLAQPRSEIRRQQPGHVRRTTRARGDAPLPSPYPSYPPRPPVGAQPRRTRVSTLRER